MAGNIIFDDGDQLSVEVISGTVSGDAVAFGNQPGVALTDRGDGGNPATHATVKFSGVVLLERSGATAGDAIYINPLTGGLELSDDGDHIFYGVAIDDADAVTDMVRVRIGGIEPGSGS